MATHSSILAWRIPWTILWAWQAIVHEVEKSWIWLRQFSTHHVGRKVVFITMLLLPWCYQLPASICHGVSLCSHSREDFPTLVINHFRQEEKGQRAEEGNSSKMASSVQFGSVAQLCLTLCNPMNRSTPGLPVHHQLLEFTQTHVHWVSDAIQPSHPLLSPSPLALNLSQHQGLFKWVSSSHQVAKVLAS